MSFQLSIPALDGTKSPITLETGQVLFVLGANGTGKSSLMQRLKLDHKENARWISAHRQSWFSSDSINLSPQQKRQTERNMRSSDLQSESRWKDEFAGVRPSMAIYDLIEMENADARSIAKAFRAKDSALTDYLAKKDAPLKTINELLRTSNLPIELTIQDDSQVVATKDGGSPYSIARLSDGERSALLIATNVLTAKTGCLILIDEPERHLHRSIISPLLTQLFKSRRDCAFVVSTHEILLPLDNPESQTLLVRECFYTKNEACAWNVDLVPSSSAIDDALKTDILGARKRIIFVEGTANQSLDQPFYSLVFPDVSVIAKSNCREVEHAVTGIRSAPDLHWIRTFGIIDSDGKSATDVTKLSQQGIYAVPAYSIEALYYHPEIQRRVMERYATVIGTNSTTQLQKAKSAALLAISSHADRLCERLAEKTVRTEFFQNPPKKADVQSKQPFNPTIDIATIVSSERSRFDSAMAASDLEALIVRYPIRETPALLKIAEQLGFQDCNQYQSAVLKLLIDDSTAVDFIRSLFGPLWADLS